MPELSSAQQQRHYAIVAQAISFLAEHANRQPTLAEVAAAVNLSEYHLQRVFAAWAGLTPKRFLQYLTKEHARQALQQTKDVLTTTLETGLSSPGRLHDLMVSCEAMSPGEIKARGKGLAIRFGLAPTCLGLTLLGWTGRGICYLAFCDGDESDRLAELQGQWPLATLLRDDTGAVQLAGQIFTARPAPGKLHLVLKGTNFQIKVWEALLRTRPAERLAYGDLARLAGSPKAQRAVGSALAANPVGYLIPCHRVIRETGQLGNYRWGAARKQALLLWESAHAEQPASQVAS